MAKAHPVTGGQANPIAERGASAQGRSIARAIGKGFHVQRQAVLVVNGMRACCMPYDKRIKHPVKNRI